MRQSLTAIELVSDRRPLALLVRDRKFTVPNSPALAPPDLGSLTARMRGPFIRLCERSAGRLVHLFTPKLSRRVDVLLGRPAR